MTENGEKQRVGGAVEYKYYPTLNKSCHKMSSNGLNLYLFQQERGACFYYSGECLLFYLVYHDR